MRSTYTKHVSQGHVIRLPQVCTLTSASRATVWRWVNNDGTFPKPFHLSPGITCWDEVELLAWIASKKAERPSRANRTPNAPKTPPKHHQTRRRSRQ
jgi:predicted DNA-binding transcriptional regulator AlpA